jgi:hypothetical protein
MVNLWVFFWAVPVLIFAWYYVWCALIRPELIDMRLLQRPLPNVGDQPIDRDQTR